jgi:hypothetical protein
VDDGTVYGAVRRTMEMKKKGGSCRCRGGYKVREDWGRWGRENVRSRRQRERSGLSRVSPLVADKDEASAEALDGASTRRRFDRFEYKEDRGRGRGRGGMDVVCTSTIQHSFVKLCLL